MTSTLTVCTLSRPVLGLETVPHFVWSTAGNDRRNGPADADVALYSLKKWANLACKGNPTVLHFLFADGVLRSSVWSKIVSSKHAFVSRLCAKHFIGFANDQLARVSGRKGRGKKGQRLELEQKYGYDVKAAMHALRLLYECEEILLSGTITLPRPERDLFIRVRTGRYSLDKVLDVANRKFAECEVAEQNSMLPTRIDRTAVSQVLTECYQNFWEAH